MYLYQAQGVRLGSELSNDEDEITETVLMSKDEVRNALANDEIKDGETLIGLQYWLTQNWYVKQKILDGFLNTWAWYLDNKVSYKQGRLKKLSDGLVLFCSRILT